MAKRIKLNLNMDEMKKYNKINQIESFNRFLQRRLCEMAGMEANIDTRKRMTKTELKTSKGTTVYLNDQAEEALKILQERYGMSFARFARQELQRRYIELFSN